MGKWRILVVGCALAVIVAACSPVPAERRVTVKGDAVVGAELTAWAPWVVYPETTRYRWSSCATPTRDDCRRVGDDDDNYTLTADDLGRYVHVVVRGSNAIGTARIRSKPLGPIEGGTPSGLSWSESELTLDRLPGTTSDAAAGMLGDVESLEGATAEVRGAAAAVLTVAPVAIEQTAADAADVRLSVDLPSDAAERYDGELVVTRDGAELLAPLELSVRSAEPAGAAATEIVEPSSDRLGTLPTGGLVVDDEVLVAVDFEEPDPAAVATAAAAATGASIIGADPALRLYQLRVPGASAADLEGLAATAAGVPGVAEAPLNHVSLDPTTAAPNDPEFGSWDATPSGANWGMEYVQAPAAWDLETGDPGERVAVIDLDNDADHGDLDGNASRAARGARLEGPSEGHGTHVAGTACAEGNNGKGVTGMAWQCDLRFFAAGFSAAATTSEMRAAVDDGARSVNMSLNYIANGNCGADDTAGGVAALRAEAEDANDLFGRAVIYARSTGRDVLWLLAAGNECGRDAELTAPGGLGARFPETTITVAAIDQGGQLASFSNLGSGVSVAAPGVNIRSTLPRTCALWGLFCSDRYGDKGGTSMATPHVTGLAALVRSAHPTKTAVQVKSCIVAASQRFGATIPGVPFRTIDAPSAVRCEDAPELPPLVDIVLALDLTGSMGGVLAQAKAEVAQLLANISSVAPATDFRFAVVSYEDYSGYFDSTPCGSNYATSYGSFGDEPFSFRSPLSGDPAVSQAAVDALGLGSGDDGPESYGRALWELAQPDTGVTLGWREGALRLVLNFGDNVPHDRDINEGVDGGGLPSDTGIDPGRNGVIDCGGDDIDFQDGALAALSAADIKLLHVDSGGGFTEPYWRYWASLTGGSYTLLGDRTLTDVLIELLGVV